MSFLPPKIPTATNKRPPSVSIALPPFTTSVSIALPPFATSVSTALPSSATSDDETATSLPLLSRDRYYASNRFTVRKGKAAKFEKRWATRKSRLASLPGFRYFNLMRRVQLDDEAPPPIDNFDYVSLTIWQGKRDFNAWRKGDAFKEAHGGTSVGAFMKAMISSLRVLKSPPRPAFYDGLLQLSSTPENVPETVDGWRKVDADGTTLLPAESFVACNQFYVSEADAAAFERRWAGRKSSLSELDGFVSFALLRRDGKAKGHGTTPVDEAEPTYMSCTVWRDRAAFQGWRDGQAFKSAHGQKSESSGEEKEASPPTRPKPLWSKPPVPVFYEGVLVISSEEGA